MFNSGRGSTTTTTTTTTATSAAWIATAAATVTVGIVGAMYLKQSIDEYGWEGTLRYIWEGDAYTPQLRNCVDTLEDAEIQRSVQESRIHTMESALELARLNTVDDRRTSKEIVQQWMEYFASECPTMSLERTLADVSDKLDKIASKIDGVVLSASDDDDTTSDLIQQIKRRKKLLSKTIVLDMERCDALMASYQVLKEQCSTSDQ
jgi:hypothetical protein